MTHPYRFRCDALPSSVTVAAFRGTEAISTLYEVKVHLFGAEGAPLAHFDRAVGEAATLEIGEEAPLVVNGIVASVELVGRAGGRPIVCAALVPKMWWLTQSLHSRVFTGRTIPDVVEEALRRGGLGPDDFAFELGGGYAPFEHVCQYRESDYDFVARWLEHEGIYFFFEQGPSRERLVITDDRSCQRRLAPEPARYVAGGGGVMSGPCVRAFRRKRHALPGSVGLRSYDALHPDARIGAVAQVGSGAAPEIRDHHARFEDGERAQRIARRRAEQVGCSQTVCRVEGTAPVFRSGTFFRLAEHPDADLNVEYLVTHLEHEGVAAETDAETRRILGFDADGTYVAEASAIPSSVQYRAPRATPWPRVMGHETGVVDGPADGELAQIDEHGRYKVKLHLDETDLAGGHASTWVRMMQPHAGSPEGMHFPLRKGTEVLLTFLGGDPDRPVIAGAVPNATRPSPVTTANASSNVIHTAAGNHFELGDARGGEFITFKTPFDNSIIRIGAALEGAGASIVFLTEGDREEETGGDKDETIDGRSTELIRGSKIETVMGFETGTILGLKTEQIGGGEIKTVVGPVVDTTIGFEDKNVVGGEVKVVIGLLPIASQINIIGGDNKNVLGPVVDNIIGGEAKFVGGGVQEMILGGVVEVIIGGKNELIVGLETKTLFGGGLEVITGIEEKVVLGGAVELVAPVDMKVVLGAMIDMVIGVEIGLVIGAKIDVVAGVTISEEEARIDALEMHFASREIEVKASDVILTTASLQTFE